MNHSEEFATGHNERTQELVELIRQVEREGYHEGSFFHIENLARDIAHSDIEAVFGAYRIKRHEALPAALRYLADETNDVDFKDKLNKARERMKLLSKT